MDEGYYALVYAVLERAVLDAVCAYKLNSSGMKSAKYVKRSAIVWFTTSCTDKEDPEPFTLDWCCLHLNLSPNVVRDYVKAEMAKYPLGSPLLKERGRVSFNIINVLDPLEDHGMREVAVREIFRRR